MKAVVYTRYGSPDVLQLKDVPMPAPGANEVLVQVMATAVNRADSHLLGGALRFSSGLLRPKRPILGSDIAGRVVGVGANATRFQVGDAVFGDLSAHGRGGFAEYVAAPEAALARKPEALSFAQAAAAPMTAVTALQGLRGRGDIQPGQQVLINGASGGVGTFAVQIARALGGRVTAVASTRHLDRLRTLGAERVIDYTRTDFTRTGAQYDLIFDTVGNHTLAAYRRALKANGRFVTAAFLPALVFSGLRRLLGSGQTMVNLMARPNQTDLAFVASLLEAGRMVSVIDRCYPLDETAEALRYVGAGHAAGKVIVLGKVAA